MEKETKCGCEECVAEGGNAKEGFFRNFGSRKGARRAAAGYLSWYRRQENPTAGLGYRRPSVG